MVVFLDAGAIRAAVFVRTTLFRSACFLKLLSILFFLALLSLSGLRQSHTLFFQLPTVQDPFTFAVAGTDALHVGRKLGSIVGMVLCMHASVTLFQVPTGPLFAMGVLSCGFVKMAFMDGIPLPPAPLGAAGVCIVLCLYDYLMNTTKGKKE